MAEGTEEFAVVVDKLSKHFGSFEAVKDISFNVKRGEIFGFLGPNGAGKSTTIRMLCGILQPSSGGGSVAGFDVNAQSEQIKANIGYMSQKFSLYEDLTVEENIDFYGGIYGLKGDTLEERKKWALQMAGLTERSSSRTSVLSGGWKQRLALGCAILHQPPIIFLDEPTSGVDPINRRRFWDLIYEMAGRGVTVFVTTHYMDEAEYCDRIALIYRGELIAIGSPRKLKEEMMEKRVIEIRCLRPQEAIGHIENLPGVSETALFGSVLHAVVDSPAGAAEKIREALGRADIEIQSIESISPSLEDVFVWLIEKHDHQAGRLAEVER